MRSSQSCRLAAVLFTLTTNAVAAHLDMSDPRRALAREDDVRIDAELARDTISPGTPVVLTCQIENLSNATIALADRVTDSDYDTESQTVTISVGAEVPEAGKMPHLLLVHPGEKRTITASAFVHVVVPHGIGPLTIAPRYLQVRVNLLRDVTPFLDLIERQSHAAAQPTQARLSDEQFDRWIHDNDAIVLNALPVHWENRRGAGATSAADASPNEVSATE